jgi:hypothetical protein
MRQPSEATCSLPDGHASTTSQRSSWRAPQRSRRTPSAARTPPPSGAGLRVSATSRWSGTAGRPAQRPGAVAGTGGHAAPGWSSRRRCRSSIPRWLRQVAGELRGDLRSLPTAVRAGVLVDLPLHVGLVQAEGPRRVAAGAVRQDRWRRDEASVGHRSPVVVGRVRLVCADLASTPQDPRGISVPVTRASRLATARSQPTARPWR